MTDAAYRLKSPFARIVGANFSGYFIDFIAGDFGPNGLDPDKTGLDAFDGIGSIIKIGGYTTGVVVRTVTDSLGGITLNVSDHPFHYTDWKITLTDYGDLLRSAQTSTSPDSDTWVVLAQLVVGSTYHLEVVKL